MGVVRAPRGQAGEETGPQPSPPEDKPPVPHHTTFLSLRSKLDRDRVLVRPPGMGGVHMFLEHLLLTLPTMSWPPLGLCSHGNLTSVPGP